MSKIPVKPFVFFGGKGGVGKTTCAAAFSLVLSEKGSKTLLVSTDPAHSVSDIFERGIGSDESFVRENLWAIEIDPHTEMKRYMDRVRETLKEVASPVLLEEIKRQINLAYVSPGAEEAAIFDKFIELMGEVDRTYDTIVFDTAPTGHTLRLLTLPELLGAWIDSMMEKRQKALKLQRMMATVEAKLPSGGKAKGARGERDPVLEVLKRRKEKFERARELLLDQGRTTFLFVLNPEKLPILETKKAMKILENHGIPVGGVIVNRVLPQEVEGEYFRKRKLQEQEYIEEIQQEFGGKILTWIPMLEQDVRGMEGLKQIVHYLA